MASTIQTSVTAQNRSLQTVLADYEIAHSNTAPGRTVDKKNTLWQSPEHPAWKDISHRRVPSYRPINRARDQREVRVYNHTAEKVFISVMFTGVFVNAVSDAASFELQNCTRHILTEASE
jgi:hypothetical protein